MQNIKLKKWCLMYQNSIHGKPIIQETFSTKEEAVNEFNRFLNWCRNDKRFQRDCNRDNHAVIELGEYSFMNMIKNRKMWSHSFYWLSQRDECPQWLQDIKNELEELPGNWIPLSDLMKKTE